jgi:hypothetical protein
VPHVVLGALLGRAIAQFAKQGDHVRGRYCLQRDFRRLSAMPMHGSRYGRIRYVTIGRARVGTMHGPRVAHDARCGRIDQPLQQFPRRSSRRNRTSRRSPVVDTLASAADHPRDRSRGCSTGTRRTPMARKIARTAGAGPQLHANASLPEWFTRNRVGGRGSRRFSYTRARQGASPRRVGCL